MRLPTLFLAICSMMLLIGCGGSNEPEADSPDAGPAADASALESSESPNSADPGRLDDETYTTTATLPAPGEAMASGSRQSAGNVAVENPGPGPDSETSHAVPTDRLQLAPELQPAELVQFLAKADRAMRELAANATSAADYQQLVPELKRLANLKHAAAQRLVEQPSITPAQLRKARQGRLQALSHLAAMDDLRAAEELEAYAVELAESSDPVLAVESRLVLIGFALEKLQGGAADDPGQVVQLVDELTANAELLNMPALMAISQARAVLQQYGYSEAAQDVRDQLVLGFSDHPDPQVAAMAQQMAGTERFDQLDALQRKLEQGDTVTPDQWETAATEVAEEHPDRATLQYLATAALGFESEGEDELAEVAYQVMQSQFSSSDDVELVEELNIIVDSYDARQRIIGEPLQIDLPSLQGEAVEWSDYRGKIVLVPFWAAEYPDSVQIFPLLEQIRAADPDQIAILGVSLDVNDASVSAFTSQMQPDWVSVRSTDVAERGALSPLAKQVGLASMPYVVVVDREGNVAAVSMSAGDLEQIVMELLQEA